MSARPALIAAALLASAAAGGAQRTLRGTVVDTANAPVSYANIESGGRTVVADDSGRFRLSIQTGRASVHVRRIGFAPASLDLAAGADTALTIVLQPLAANLRRVVVQAAATVRSLELRGFYRRLQDRQNGINAGQFITAEEIERRNPFRTTQMLEGRSGIKVIRASSPGVCFNANSPVCWAPAGLNGCYMTVYYDNTRLTPLIRQNEPTFVDDVVLPSHVAGIEIYTTAGKVPPEYQLLAGTCGVVLIWSK